MGSLPNLNELHREKIEKRAEERERELAREAVIDRDFPLTRDTSYGRERLPTFIHQVG
jgi:glutamate mutase epsilon subunit